MRKPDFTYDLEAPGMANLRNQRGFTFIGILITVVIICILAAGSMQLYTGSGAVGPAYKKDTVLGGLDITLLKTRLRALGLEQNLEYSMRQQYVSDLQTLLNRSLGTGYYPNANAPVPAVPMFDLKMEMTPEGYTIRAVPNTLAGAPSDSPTYIIDQSMTIREEKK
jgi:hypothetical protein